MDGPNTSSTISAKSNPLAESFLTPDEVAKELRVTRQTVYMWLRSGRLAGKRFGGVWRIPSGSITNTP